MKRTMRNNRKSMKCTTMKLGNIGITLSEQDTWDSIMSKVTDANISGKYNFGKNYFYTTSSENTLQILKKDTKESEAKGHRVLNRIYEMFCFGNKLVSLKVSFDSADEIPNSIKEFITSITGYNAQEFITSLRMLGETKITDDIHAEVVTNEHRDMYNVMEPTTWLKSLGETEANTIQAVVEINDHRDTYRPMETFGETDDIQVNEQGDMINVSDLLNIYELFDICMKTYSLRFGFTHNQVNQQIGDRIIGKNK